MGLCGPPRLCSQEPLPCIASFELSCLFQAACPDTRPALSFQREPSLCEREAATRSPTRAPPYTWHLGKHGLSAGLFPRTRPGPGWGARRETASGSRGTCARLWGSEDDSDISSLGQEWEVQ